MAPQPTPPAPLNEPIPDDALPIGPQSGLSSIPTQYIEEQSIQQMLRNIGYDEAREDSYRLKGVQLIDSVRQSLQLPVKTFDTAAIYYHKFRIRFPSSEYNYEDVALASLFVACKVEDTIKKSKEILCAAHNLRQPHDNKTPDDKIFESPSRFTVGLERHILETIGFDFRVQYPQKLLIKMVRTILPQGSGETERKRRKFLEASYDMSIDIYKTFSPIKQSASTLVQAILELTARIMDVEPDKIKAAKGSAHHTERGCVYETLQDLLDLYTQFPKMTKIGAKFDLNRLIDVKIDINKLVSADKFQRTYDWCDRCPLDMPDVPPVTPGSATSPATNTSLSGNSTVKRKAATSEATLRFVFDAEEARKERDLVAEHFNDEYEEHETEVEETIREEPRYPANNSRSGHPHRGHGHTHNNHEWGPYSRSRHGHNSERLKGRKGHGYY
ncbi:C-terminal domain kinase-like protein [Lasiosphaeris hirsuta]|uniref:RNA polymerase II holoenzyme cyclin-like subunit n=1 Tax=Lasiosphaeris hirsuta TaxID=260670 RepID=A0AA40AGC0_9PEZI|nr:C-terminal domain kinase-like protein [Lasiosphaeris hirsuta]